MIIGIGTDIIEISRLAKAKPSFVSRVYSERELDGISENPNRRAEQLAGMFAAKEAVVKALGCGFGRVLPNEVEILHNDSGQPFVTLSDNVNSVAEQIKAATVHVSISHCNDYAVAYVVIEMSDNLKPQKTKQHLTNKMPTLIYKIQKFSIHDGRGIRTTVFFKGCPLRCTWCHNPESQSFKSEGAGITEYDGQEWSLPALLNELEKDLVFYEESGGGVTLSGGEPLAQDMEYIVNLIRRLKRKGISVCIDTCGDVPYENFHMVIPYIDLFLYDVKLWGNELHIAHTGASNERILSNLSRLGKSGANICLRLPLIAGLNDSPADMEYIANWLDVENVRPVFVSLLPYHGYAKNKYAQLGIELPSADFAPPEQAHLEQLKAFWEQRGYAAGIGGAVAD